MEKYQCPKCKAKFADNAHLRRHSARKTPCDPILVPRAQSLSCRYCGREFTTTQALSRHVRHRCKIANTDEGMDKLMDYTLQRQLAEMRTENAEIRTQVERLSGLLEKQLAVPPAPAALAANGDHSTVTSTVNTGLVTNVAHMQVINIAPWDEDGDRLKLGVAQMVAAFAENARLREFAQMPERQLTDLEVAPPYVTELLMDLVKRGHADPARRNVYLNPRRADQALVHLKSGVWEVLPLADATRLMFDGVVKTIHQVTMTHAELRQLPLEAQNALAMAGMMYRGEPEEYVQRAKGPMSAHLTNMAPAPAGVR